MRRADDLSRMNTITPHAITPQAITPQALTSLPQRPSVIAFDAYGTLLDVHSAVGRLADRIGPLAGAFSAHWRLKQLEYSWVLSLAGRYRDFWQLTGEALDNAFGLFPGVDRALRPELLDAYRSLSAYPDALPALTRLRAAGHRLCLFSNGEPSMLEEAAISAGLRGSLDAIVSVHRAQVFKTAPAAYALVTETFGCAPAEAALVSSNRWDIAGGGAFGFTGVWVNRAGMPDEYPGLEPAAVVRDLGAL
jgi:2-haloacid dehalogenase